MQIIKENEIFLRKLATTKSDKKRNILLENATPGEILTLLEMCINILRSRVKLTNCQRKKLAVHAEFLRKFSKCRTEKTARKIIQTGNGALFPALILPILAKLLLG